MLLILLQASNLALAIVVLTLHLRELLPLILRIRIVLAKSISDVGLKQGLVGSHYVVLPGKVRILVCLSTLVHLLVDQSLGIFILSVLYQTGLSLVHHRSIVGHWFL